MPTAIRILLGSALGAAVGYGIAKFMEREVTVTATPDAGDALLSQTGPKESFKERIARAKTVAAEARAAREAELRALFRQKVQDPDALSEMP